jgi:formamidopyrimidine-DNA glycosylase
MPELPEVETIKRDLEEKVEGQVISRISPGLSRMLSGCTPAGLRKAVAGSVIRGLVRRGKYLVFELDRGALIFHMGMSGRLLFINGAGLKQAPSRYRLSRPRLKKEHVHLVMAFNGGDYLLFRDPRTFGRVIHVPSGDWKNHEGIARLGPEPLDLRPASFLRKSLPVTSRRCIKAFLLDQSFICGLGNIYCDEALFVSRIHPEQEARSLTEAEWRCLLKQARRVLRKGIRNAGTTFSDYRKPDGTVGGNQDQLLVYGRGGEPCTSCGGMLVKKVVAQRGTVFCPRCQPLVQG